MKLRAKSDHRIREFGIDERCSHPYYTRDEYGNTCHYKTLKEVADNWEEVPEEPKKYWYVYGDGVLSAEDNNDFGTNTRKAIGNYFETKEEAEEAVAKLKAWKRLKDKGFRFTGYTDDSGDLFSCQVVRCSFDDFGKESREDLCLLFSGGGK